MKGINVRVTCGFVFGTFIGLLPAVGAQVDCDRHHPGALQRAIDRARPGHTILVSGTCKENVTIPDEKARITLDGGGKATINGPDANENTISVRGRGIVIKGFTITGGLDGIRVLRGGQATIDGNTVEKTGQFGIVVTEVSSAIIVNNTVQYNSGPYAVVVNGSSFAHIGFLNGTDTAASPNVIQYNGGSGIFLERSASARIVGNDIRHNGGQGVWVIGSSHANISDNMINANGGDGIRVSEGSGAVLGQDTGDTIFTRPNSTKTLNGGFGIQCRIGYMRGRLGSLNGESGAQSHRDSCINNRVFDISRGDNHI